eukprot:scaffold8942_cov99-Isochrysis_galbana.AAC.7
MYLGLGGGEGRRVCSRVWDRRYKYKRWRRSPFRVSPSGEDERAASRSRHPLETSRALVKTAAGPAGRGRTGP